MMTRQESETVYDARKNAVGTMDALTLVSGNPFVPAINTS